MEGALPKKERVPTVPGGSTILKLIWGGICFIFQGLTISNRTKPGNSEFALISGLQEGPAERGHVKKRQKSSKSVKMFFDTFRQFSRRAKKNVKNRRKVSTSFRHFSTKFSRGTFFLALLRGIFSESVSRVIPDLFRISLRKCLTSGCRIAS